MNNEIDFCKSNPKKIIARIRERRKTLTMVSRSLKKHFVGLDHIIDRIIKNIETWYVMPELLTRPVIICLWGATGVGKTDLVRRLVKLLNFHDRFCEVEMMNKGGSSSYPWRSTISSILHENPKIESGKPCILLLDEIQNFRTVSEDGHELPEYKFRDIWALLSDGKLPFHVELDYLFQLLWEYDDKKESGSGYGTTIDDSDESLFKRQQKPPAEEFSDFKDDKNEPKDYELDDNIDEDEGLFDYNPDKLYEEEEGVEEIPVTADCGRSSDPGTPVAPRTHIDNYSDLKHFKNLLKLPNSLEEIATWSCSKKRSVIVQKINDQDLYEEMDYTKSLIFISGNIDEAYIFAKKTNEVDVDANIFHELSLKINLLDIKKSLGMRFKPEQIARLGNLHVIYPTLSQKNYEIIIKRKIAEIIKNVENKYNIKMCIDDSIYDLIYNNGVFPTQGTRPVFSTISEIVESSLPTFLLQSFLKNKGTIKIYYKNNNIYGQINKNVFKYPYRGSIDSVKDSQNRNINHRILSAVHEAGHGIVYATLFRHAPSQILSSSASSEMSGFIWAHEICGAKKMIENKICVMLAGGIAEQMVFGKENMTWGLADDLHEATKLAGLMSKRYGMEKFSSFIAHPTRSDIVNTNLKDVNSVIESVIVKFKQKAEDILKSNDKLFKDIIDCLLSRKTLSSFEFKDICARHNLKIKIRKSEQVIYSNYYKKYLSFKNSSK